MADSCETDDENIITVSNFNSDEDFNNKANNFTGNQAMLNDLTEAIEVSTCSQSTIINESSNSDCEIQEPELPEIINIEDSPIKDNSNHISTSLPIKNANSNHYSDASSSPRKITDSVCDSQSSSPIKKLKGKTLAATLVERFQRKKDKMSGLNGESTKGADPAEPKVTEIKPVDIRYISGVQVEFPVKPYGAQVIMMAKLIQGINKSQNCLLESPTGSGKTLALLCSALAWQKNEKERIRKILLEKYNTQNQWNSQPGNLLDPLLVVAEELAKPAPPAEEEPVPEVKTSSTAKKNKEKKCIYYDSNSGGEDEDSPDDETAGGKRIAAKRQVLSPDAKGDAGLVNIHKKPKVQNADANRETDHSSLSQSASSSQSSGYQQTSSQFLPSPSKFSKHDEDGGNKYRVPRIYYGTRTHKQLEQVISELKKTTYGASIKMSILSSREFSCIRNDVNREYKSKTEMCKAIHDTKVKPVSDNPHSQDSQEKKKVKGCEFKMQRLKLVMSPPPGSWDIEDLVVKGRELNACPYFAARDLAQQADIIFCPYNYILDPTIRESVSIDVTGAIVLLDEAHNIEDSCREYASLTFEEKVIAEALKEVEYLVKMASNYTPPKHTIIFYYLKKYFNSWTDWFENHAPLTKKQFNGEYHLLMNGPELAASFKNHNIGFKEYPEFKGMVQEVVDELSKIREERNSGEISGYVAFVSESTGNLLESLRLQFDFFYRNACLNLDDFKGNLIKKEDYQNAEFSQHSWLGKSQRTKVPCMTLRFSCMNPGLVFESVQKQSRCVVLASGTLSPTLSFPAELAAEFPIKLQAPHVISHKQVWVGSIISGPQRVPLECTFRHTSSSEWQDALGEVLLWICSQVPHGVLCFVTSYRLMENLQDRWEATGMWRRLEEKKSMFTEGRRLVEHNKIMSDYYSCVGNGRGALLMAVFRGKVSEGMDFRDHQCRAVVTVGIPYPNIKDVLVEGKRKYNDLYRTQRGLLSGQEWLSVQAYRALNQALGRCVRHVRDWGAVFMVDARFQNPANTEHISRWIKDFLGNNHLTWENLLSSNSGLVNFIQEMTYEDTQKGQ